ncbi:hypothetical protein M409DRAFT_22937 [Zasmidium cellare ATCC 36951]|uniref:Histone chaperone RTT106/FACT complex subunit SPT16-like middle domain-containing protein n=1 Tax=Zasmidium cellare ATCC 36951 TaxID=1080233 RepID=A0A6A6CIB2_ZASCE|nr:uncharacterized protein M409DRAFT_22937 [Zasmidium cellare ATCC 36951]KAF2166885.1 hypothetical protein M409DRAFT_22937 [Zasmidium cellare ATCC 36951]
MAQQQWASDIHNAFQHDQTLDNRIHQFAQRYQGQLDGLFGDIAKYVLSRESAHTAPSGTSKKRKLDDASQPAQAAPNGSSRSVGISNPVTTFECKNVSFQIPARKKLKLQLVADQAASRKREIRLIDPKTESTEHTLSNAQIDQIFCLPVPEKQQRQWNFCVFPAPGAATEDGTPCEQMVFTLNETKPDDATSSTRAAVEGDTYVTVTEPEFDQLLQVYGKSIVKPTDTEFASSIPQAHRKGEKAYHVKAHKGTKEGYLFFLPNGIVFGFKKPLSFFPFSAIESVSYTSVLQRTFNLVIAATEGNSTEVKEVEFSMLDQADFAGIDEYVKRHGLNDASMAADRKAKAYNVNKEPKSEPNGDAAGALQANGGDDGLTELQRAEQQLQDDEDEEEEDYEASGGESDGEGEDSDDEDGKGGEYAEYEEGEEVEEYDEEVEHDEDVQDE